MYPYVLRMHNALPPYVYVQYNTTITYLFIGMLFRVLV